MVFAVATYDKCCQLQEENIVFLLVDEQRVAVGQRLWPTNKFLLLVELTGDQVIGPRVEQLKSWVVEQVNTDEQVNR